MAGDKFWHCLLSNIWPLIGQTGPYSGFAFYWLWDHIFDFIGRQAEIDFGRIYEVALLFSTFPPITDNPDSEISWSQPMRWGKISRQECGVYWMGTGLTVRSKSGHLGSGEAWSQVPLSGSRVPENWSDPGIPWAYFFLSIKWYKKNKEKQHDIVWYIILCQ